MTQTLIDKIWDAHLIGQRADGRDLLYMDRLVLHDLHAPHAFRRLTAMNRTVRRPDLVFSALDHAVGTRPGRDGTTNPEGTEFIRATRAESRARGIPVFDLGEAWQGISHVVAPELGMVLPGATHAVPDSHACTVGGLGALGFGCGTSELEHVLATQVMALKRPKQMRITLEGALAPHVGAKDVILHVVSRLGLAGGRGFYVEFAGPVARAMSVEARMTLCNMIIEFGARSGLVAPDDKVFNWIAGREMAPSGGDWERAMAQWRTLRSDDDAEFASEMTVDCSSLAPQISWGTDPSQVIGIADPVPDGAPAALAYMGLTPGRALEDLPVDRVFIGSCTNARIEDLRVVAGILRGRHIAADVQALIVPGSSAVKRQAESEGLNAVFAAAGVPWHESGCSMCAGANGDTAQRGQRVLATSNRNFENRQGPGVRTHLVSPATAAAAIVTGRITDVRKVA
jgi:3-isopropylmalate/(R)-2-methylmalate dehydratase large subunit